MLVSFGGSGFVLAQFLGPPAPPVLPTMVGPPVSRRALVCAASVGGVCRSGGGFCRPRHALACPSVPPAFGAGLWLAVSWGRGWVVWGVCDRLFLNSSLAVDSHVGLQRGGLACGTSLLAVFSGASLGVHPFGTLLTLGLPPLVASCVQDRF